MSKRHGDFYGGRSAGHKRFRGDDHAGSDSGSRTGPTDPNVLSAVGTLLTAVSSSQGSGNQLASVLSTVLTAVAGASRGNAGSSSSEHRNSRPPLQTPSSSSGRSRRAGKWDAVVIPSACVGWLKGRQGGMIKEIESKSGASVEIDQSTKEQGHCTVTMHGDDESKRRAYGFVVAEMLKVADQPDSNMDCAAIGTKLSFTIDAKYVGWVKGPRGKVVQDISNKSYARVDVDQNDAPHGMAVVNIYGTHDNVGFAKELVAFELGKVNPEAAAEINATSPLPRTPSRSSTSHAYPPADAASESSLQIPSSYVGWLKGRQGQMIKEIESRSGATIDIDQSTKEAGHCSVRIQGSEEGRRRAYGFVVAEVMKVSDHSGVPLDDDIGTKIEVTIEDRYVGWVKGPRGKVVQDITTRSSTRVDVDQHNAPPGQAVIKIFGTHEGVAAAKDIVAFELSKVSPDAAADINAVQVPQPRTQAGGSSSVQHVGSSSSSRYSQPGGGDGVYDALMIPGSYVGWIKGKQGAMVRDIEARSGAAVNIDQSDRDSGTARVNFRGEEDEKMRAFGLVLAEAIKVADQGGAVSFDYACYGTKEEFQLDNRYVGWVKGPRGKVVQDISTRSSTRVDTDQSNPDFATLRIYGTYEGVRDARGLIAQVLSEVSPEAAAEIAPDGFVPEAEQVAEDSTAASLPQTDAAALTAALTTALGSAGQAPPGMSQQQQAVAELTRNFLQQLATVAPDLVNPGLR